MSGTLTVLLAQAIAVESLAVDARTGVSGSLALGANVLQHLPGPRDDGLDVRTLPARSCLSKRALVTGIRRSERMGLVTVEQGPGRGEKLIRLTSAGVAALEAWGPTAATTGVSTQLREALVSIVGGLDLEHPHFPTQYGTADISITGGPGQDWKPVARVEATAHVSLPVSALASQAFCALAIAYERANGALGWVASVLSVTGPEGLRVADLPRWGSTMLGGMERHGRVRVAGGQIIPTTLGAAQAARHEPTLASIERSWRERYGDVLVDELSTSLGAVVAGSAGAVDDVRHPPTHALFGYRAA